MILLLTPIIWVKKIYKAKIEMLGIKKGRWPLSLTIIVGIGTGAAYYFFTQAILSLPLDVDRFLTKNFYIAMLSKQIFSEIFDSVLTPITEEVVNRGFVYGYLRKKVGVLLGLLIQSIVFTFFHLDYIMNDPIPQIIHKFILGLILGVLYEVSGSLYPSMICHGTLNFLAVRIPVSIGSNF
jgi:membrane protease YdiL (CAAX protease family)